MTKKKVPWMTQVKRVWASASQRLKTLVGAAKEKVDIDSHFSRLALKWDRISKGVVNLSPTLMGIFDRETLTLTVRAEESLEKGELLETERVQYRVEEVRPERVSFPLQVDQATHLISCKVAVLARI